MPHSRYSDPVENLNSYVMVHGGIDRDERLNDVQWMRDVVEAAREAVKLENILDQGKADIAIDTLRRALKA